MTSAVQERGGQQMTTPFITLQSTGSDQSADMRNTSEDGHFAVREVRRFFGKARAESLTKKRRATTYTLASSGDPTTPQSQEEIQFFPL
jgi:hypothetical protein